MVSESSRVREDVPLIRTNGASDSLDDDGRAGDGLEAARGSLGRCCWTVTTRIVLRTGEETRRERIWGVGFSPATPPVVASIDGGVSRRPWDVQW